MAIRIIEGVIGSGKTYYAVRHVAKSYFDYNKDLTTYTPKDPNIVVYSNIENFGLALPLDPVIQEAGGSANFFNMDYQKNFIAGRKAIYVIDEAQGPQFFHRKFYNPQVFYFFQYHRHLGIDIYLITQDVFSLARELRDLAEYHIKAVRRTHSLMGEFRYHFMAGEEKWKSQTLKPEKQYFSLYTSMQSKEVEKVPSAARRYAVIILLLVVSAYLIFRYGFIELFVPDSPYAVKSVEAKTIPVPVPVVQVSSSLSPIPLPVVPAVVSLPPPEEKYLEVTITGLLQVLDSGVSHVFFIDSQGREFNMTGFDFDRLCKCNTFARLKSGDTLEIIEPPKGTRYRKEEKGEGAISAPSPVPF